MVVDAVSGAPIASATVSLEALNITDQTNWRGQFMMTLPARYAGEQVSITVTKAGYLQSSEMVRVPPDAPIIVKLS
jgi:hypothetical protein